MPGEPIEELQRRAEGLRLVLSDCDGVLTDGTVYVSERGEELKRFSLRDGMGVERLRNAGVDTAIITREKSGFAARRAEKLKLPYVYLGIWDKRAELDRILDETDTTPDQLAYIGDDYNDLEIIKVIAEEGLTGAPADAIPAVAEAVHFQSNRPGGGGAFREFAEWLLALRESPPPA